MSARRAGSAAVSGRGELTADRAERPAPTEESGGTSTPVAQVRLGGRGAPVRSAAGPRHCVQCPASVRSSG